MVEFKQYLSRSALSETGMLISDSDVDQLNFLKSNKKTGKSSDYNSQKFANIFLFLIKMP